MASEVTVESRPHAPVAFPPRCCYCLAPATTTHPVRVQLPKVRTGRYTRARFAFPVAVPYCAAHGADARRFDRFDSLATAGLFAGAIVLLVAFELTAGAALRAMGAAIWWCATVLVMAALGVGGALIYVGLRRMLRRRYPAADAHSYSGTLGVRTASRALPRADPRAELAVAITFTFSNDAFAAEMAALHGVEARSAQAP